MPAVVHLFRAPIRALVAFALVTSLASLLALAAAPPTRAAQHAVQISNFAFSPAGLTITAGDTVNWTNGDEAAHTVNSDTGAFDSGNLDSGQGFSFTFTQPGTYTYRCDYHREMQGTIVVQAASAPVPTPSPASGGPAPGGTAAPATGGDGGTAGESPSATQPNTALDTPASLAWLAPLLIGLGLVALAFGVVPYARERVRDED